MAGAIESSFGGGGAARLAPDLLFPSAKVDGSATYKLSAVTDYSTGGLVEAFPTGGLVGPGIVTGLKLLDLTAESITVKLTVDGVIIWNDTFTCATSETLIGHIIQADTAPEEAYLFYETWKLELTTIDSAIQVLYAWRPVIA